MDKLEKVEKIREKTGASYADALEALDLCEGDILDAIVYLEKSGKIENKTTAQFSSDSSAENKASERLVNATAEYDKSSENATVGDGVDSFFEWVKKVVRKSIDTKFTVNRNKDQVLQVPVLVLVLAFIFFFWIALPLMVIGLFFDCRYHFEGVDKVTVDVNDFCDRAADGATNMKNSGKAKKAEKQAAKNDDKKKAAKNDADNNADVAENNTDSTDKESGSDKGFTTFAEEEINEAKKRTDAAFDKASENETDRNEDAGNNVADIDYKEVNGDPDNKITGEYRS